MPERKSEKKLAEKKMKLRWRKYKTGSMGVIVVTAVATLLIVIGIFSLMESSGIGYAFLIFGAILFCAAGYDIYRMYGY